MPATSAPSLKELGIGLAVAIGLDATVVRLVVVPATMRLLGEWNWWYPSSAELLSHFRRVRPVDRA